MKRRLFLLLLLHSWFVKQYYIVCSVVEWFPYSPYEKCKSDGFGFILWTKIGYFCIIRQEKGKKIRIISNHSNVICCDRLNLISTESIIFVLKGSFKTSTVYYNRNIFTPILHYDLWFIPIIIYIILIQPNIVILTCIFYIH